MIESLLDYLNMRKPHLLPNFFTALSLCCGLFVIFKMSMIEPHAVTGKELTTAAVILLVAGLFDVLDGAVARAMRVESDFGGFFDSMSDAITFGVAPAVIAVKGLSPVLGTFYSFMVLTAAMAYAVSGVFRLVRFSVTQHQIQGDVEKMADFKSHFTGLPIPAAALSVTSLVLFMLSDEGKHLVSLSQETQCWIASIALFLLGYFMASRWKFPSAKALHFRIRSYETVAFVAILTSILIVGTVNYFTIMLFVVTWGYFLISFFLSLTRLILGRRIKLLEDFDMDDEPHEDER